MYQEERIKQEFISFVLKEVEEKYEIYKKKTKNQHDKLIKDILSNPEEFCEFINHFIATKEAEKVKIEKIEQTNSSFITKSYAAKEADILYKQKDKELYYLIEHQSTIDNSMVYRILNYTIAILNNAIDNKKLKQKEYKLPKIIPIVIYTGKGNWNAETTLQEKQITTPYKDYLEMKYILLDINKYKNEELLKQNTQIAYAFLIEKSKTKEQLTETLEQIANQCDTREKAEKMYHIVKFILVTMIGEEEAIKYMDKFKLKGRESIMEIQDYWIRELNQEKKKGRKEGRIEGIKEGIIQIAKNMIDANMLLEDICKITGLTKEEVNKLKLED